MRKNNPTVLALYPNTRGLGYAVFDSPKDLVDYGMGYIKPVSNTKTITRVKEYIQHYKPDIVLVRAIRQSESRKMKRVENLVAHICNQASAQGLKVYRYNRNQIQEIFSQFGSSTKFHISKKISEWYPELQNIKNPVRKFWETEYHNAGIFDAISLGVTHFYIEE